MRKKLDLREKIKKIGHEDSREHILKAKSTGEIELKEPDLRPEIEDFALELEGTKSEGTIVDSVFGERMDQILTVEGGKDVKWTAAVDSYAEKFASMIKEGLVEVKTRPPIYGARFQESSLLASHMDGYTFTLASYMTDFDKLVEIFTLALDKAREKTSPT